MYDENPIFLYWDLASKGSTKLLSEYFALCRVQVVCWLIRTSSTVSPGSHTYDFYFILRMGTHPTQRITPKSMYLWHSHCFLLHFKSMMRPSLIIDFQSSAVKVLCSLSCVNCVFLCVCFFFKDMKMWAEGHTTTKTQAQNCVASNSNYVVKCPL